MTGETPAAGGAGSMDPAAWLKAHPKAALGAAAGAVALLAYATRNKGTDPTVDQGATDPAAAADGTSATDLYNTLQPELQNVGDRITGLEDATAAGLGTVSGQVRGVSGQVSTVSHQVTGVSAQVRGLKPKPKPKRPHKVKKPKKHHAHRPSPRLAPPAARPKAAPAAPVAKPKAAKPSVRGVVSRAVTARKAAAHKPAQAHPAAHKPAAHPSPVMRTKRHG